MSIEYTLVQYEIALANPANLPATMAVSTRTWRSLSQIALGCLLLTYLVGCFQDFQRVRDLRAEPSLSPKVTITKREAWDRVHPRNARPTGMAAAARAPRPEVVQPLPNPSADARLVMLDF
ncbi:MAG TPA: hypothetical protein VF431_06075 [Candidatus Methylomirabilis sp.]|jgi:hypothetical protein